jgi:hypothetical protein
MRRTIAASTIGILAIALAGCATILGKSQRPVTITSHPDGAEISIVNRAGETIYKGATPTTVTLKAGSGYFKSAIYTVSFSRDGYLPRQAEIAHRPNGWYLGGNLVFGGVIGWLVVDPVTGAMWKLDDLDVVLEPDGDASHVEGSLNILQLDDVPEDLRGSLVPLR